MDSRNKYSVYEMIPVRNKWRTSIRTTPFDQHQWLTRATSLTLIAQRSEEWRGSIFQSRGRVLYLIDILGTERLPLQPWPRLLLHHTVQEVLWRHVQLSVKVHGGELDEAPLSGRQPNSLLVRVLFLGERRDKRQKGDVTDDKQIHDKPMWVSDRSNWSPRSPLTSRNKS